VPARRRAANAWLGLLVLAIGALSFCDSGVWRGALFGVLDWSIAALGPLYFCYARSLTGRGDGDRLAWHFLPSLLAAGAFAWMRETLLALPAGVYPPPAWQWTFNAVLLGSQAVAAIYLCAVLWLLRDHRRRVRACFSETARRDLSWLARLTGATLVLMVLWVLTALIPDTVDNALRVGRMALLFFIGWYGVGQSVVFVPDLLPETASADVVPVPSAASPVETSPEPAATASRLPKYSRSGLNESARALISERLAKRMQTSRDYLEGDLTLAELAERIGTSPQWLSQYLNEALGSSFFDYINGLRVCEAQMAMLDSARAGQSLLEVAFAAGFNSKSTFNSAFKKMTGMAPSRWRAAHATTSEPIR
jgi:AraC-like DNA-binding protein